MKLQKIPNKDESKLYPLFHSIVYHRATLEKMIGFSLLTDKQAKILTLDNNQKTEERRFNDDTIRWFIILVARNEFFDE